MLINRVGDIGLILAMIKILAEAWHLMITAKLSTQSSRHNVCLKKDIEPKLILLLHVGRFLLKEKFFLSENPLLVVVTPL